jgi:hypothetical protein
VSLGFASPPSRRRARISPPSKSHAIRLPRNKPAAWRIAAGMLVVPLLVNTVSFVFTVRIVPPLFLLVYPLWFSHNPFSPRFDCEVSLARTLCRLCRGIWAWNASSRCITDSGQGGAASPRLPPLPGGRAGPLLGFLVAKRVNSGASKSVNSGTLASAARLRSETTLPIKWIAG